MKHLRFDVFGRQVVITASEGGWEAFYLGVDGKRRPATDIVVPKGTPQADLELFLEDLCHEWATEQHPSVERLA